MNFDDINVSFTRPNITTIMEKGEKAIIKIFFYSSLIDVPGLVMVGIHQ